MKADWRDNLTVWQVGQSQFVRGAGQTAGTSARGDCGSALRAVAATSGGPARRILRCMTRFVVDAETLVHIVATGVRIHPDHQLVAPNLVRSQALFLLFARVRSGELAEAEALQLHERLTELKMRLLGDRVSRRTAWRIAREQGWDTIGNAEYLAVTRLQADALVTVDDSLARLAEGIVPVAPPAALTSAGPATAGS